MKLYYSPGACSLSPHIALRESGLAFEAIAAPTKTHKLPDGTDYYTINPLGYVPLLQLDDGTRLREGPAIVQYIADQVPAKKLAPAKGFSPLFNAATPAEYKTMVIDRLLSRLKWVDGELAGKQYLMGEQFSVADGYLFTVTSWGKHVGVDISPLAHLSAFMGRVAARPAVQQALKAEGLLN